MCFISPDFHNISHMFRLDLSQSVSCLMQQKNCEVYWGRGGGAVHNLDINQDSSNRKIWRKESEAQIDENDLYMLCAYVPIYVGQNITFKLLTQGTLLRRRSGSCFPFLLQLLQPPQNLLQQTGGLFRKDMRIWVAEAAAGGRKPQKSGCTS